MKLNALCIVIGLLMCSSVAATEELMPSMPSATARSTPDAHRLYQPDSAHWVCDYLLFRDILGTPAGSLWSSSEIEHVATMVAIPDTAVIHGSLGRYVRFGQTWRGPFIISVSDEYVDRFDLLEHVVSDDAPSVPRWSGAIPSSPVCQADLAADPSSIMMTGPTRADGDINLIGRWPLRRVAVEWPLYTSVTATGDTLATQLLGSDHDRVMRILGIADYELSVTIEQYRYDRRRNRWSAPKLIGPMPKESFDRRRVQPISPEVVPRRVPMPYNAPYPVTLQE